MDLKKCAMDLQQMLRDCQERRITLMSKWASEILFSIEIPENLEIPENFGFPAENEFGKNLEKFSFQERKSLLFAQSCIDCQELDRAAFCLKNQNHPTLKFLHLYAKFLSGEKKKEDDRADLMDVNNVEPCRNPFIEEIAEELIRIKKSNSTNFDSWLRYLRAIILKEQKFVKEAIAELLISINENPTFWGAWSELSTLVSRHELDSILQRTAENPNGKFPDHWMLEFFLLKTYLSLQMTEECIDLGNRLQQFGFASSPFVLSSVASAYYGIQQMDSTIQLYETIRTIDPFRIEDMDTYSYALYVKDMVVELSALAHEMHEVNKYSPETCIIVANYYGRRGEHMKAIQYIQRALRLDPNKTDAYTLMGHEYVELQNTSAAIQSYRKALDVNPKDYKAWYALGQNYEMLKMYSYALYYHQMAHKVRPFDSRPLVALGEMYERLNRPQDAAKCYWKAHCVGDIEGQALMKLARLYDSQKDPDQAAGIFCKYLESLAEKNETDEANQMACYKFLAEYCIGKNQIDAAYDFASKYLDYDMSNEHAKGILKRIASIRAADESSTSRNEFDDSMQFGGTPA